MTTQLDPEREKEAREFLSQTLGKTVDGDFGDILKDGILLCELINKLKPGTVGKINKFKQPFMQMENIGNYIEASRAMGVPNEYQFMTVDLFERKNLAQVALNLIALKRQLGLGFNKQTAASGAKVLDIPTPQAEERKIGDSVAAQAMSPRSQTQLKPGVFRAGIVQTDATRTCSICSQPITGACIEALTKFFHPNHFECGRCAKNLANKNYHIVEAKPYCDDCITWVKSGQTGQAKKK
jgi:hypothetical protein